MFNVPQIAELKYSFKIEQMTEFRYMYNVPQIADSINNGFRYM